MTAAPLIIEGLSFAYGATPALRDVDLVVEPGSFTALLGPNGAGKSTLFSLVTRLLAAPKGRITVSGFDMDKQPAPALADMGVVFQQPTLDLDLTVRQNLRYFAGLHGIPTALADRRIDTELTRFAMADRSEVRVRALNGGHRRRVEIARALLHQPRLLLLDEATVGLDVPTRRAIVDHVHRLCRDDGIATLWATHLIDEVAGSDRCVVLSKGQVVATGTADAIVGKTGTADLAQAFDHLTAEVG